MDVWLKIRRIRIFSANWHGEDWEWWHEWRGLCHPRYPIPFRSFTHSTFKSLSSVPFRGFSYTRGGWTRISSTPPYSLCLPWQINAKACWIHDVEFFAPLEKNFAWWNISPRDSWKRFISIITDESLILLSMLNLHPLETCFKFLDKNDLWFGMIIWYFKGYKYVYYNKFGYFSDNLSLVKISISLYWNSNFLI